jgi:16S rRNA (guanine966-N2)-methyltransferase
MRDVNTGLPHAPMKQRSDDATAGKVRIIGGRWRGTRLAVFDRPGLRPTADRVRETLFNWLAPVLPGARVLDLFAGTGALGIEAVSRGAAHAVLVERDAAAAQALRDTAAKLQGGDALAVVQSDALAWLHAQPDGAFDIAFVDPPFDANLWGGVLPVLAPKLAEQGWLYVEAPVDAAPEPPPGWILHREGQTREVRYALYRRAPGVPAGGAVTLATDSGTDDAATE